MGSWSPDATNWANVSVATRRELDGEAFHDGGFWIGFQDFLKYFDTIDFCHINTDVDREVVFNGRWEVGLNAGGVQKGDWANYARNPQCFIKLRSPNRFFTLQDMLSNIDLCQRGPGGSVQRGDQSDAEAAALEQSERRQQSWIPGLPGWSLSTLVVGVLNFVDDVTFVTSSLDGPFGK